MPIRRGALLALCLLASNRTPADAQRRVTLAGTAGYLSAGGGDPAWSGSRGPAAGLDLGVRLGRHTGLVLGTAFHWFPSTRSIFACGPEACVRPQTIATERRRTAITVDLLFRLQGASGTVRPYGVIGLGHATVRPRDHVVATAPDGSVISDDRFGSDSQAGGLVLGGGIETGDPDARVAFTAGVRGRLGLSGYDGGPTAVRMISLMAGVVLR